MFDVVKPRLRYAGKQCNHLGDNDMQHLNKTIITLAALFAMGSTGISLAQAKDVSKMTYKNNGVYNAFFNVRYNLQDGKNCTVYLPNEAFTGTGLTAKWVKDAYALGNLDISSRKNDKVSVDLTSNNFKIYKGPDNCLSSGGIPDGTRVWGKIDIDAGDEVSCKKSIALIKQSSGGTTVDYRSSGTTLNNNRCKQDIN
ncbi:MAG: hypothetical protein KDK04_20615 [Candidatus Competibacteraceae bacterium]|nr:hypothetical protein [Candidatus Competibacteraceae bacterium]